MGIKLLGKTDILNIDDRRFEVVDVPEWGGAVRMASISGAERDAYEDLVRQHSEGKRTFSNFRARMVSMACVDESGNRLFSTEDIAELGKKNAAVINRLFDIALKLAGIRKEELDGIEENFPDGQSEGSTSD